MVRSTLETQPLGLSALGASLKHDLDLLERKSALTDPDGGLGRRREVLAAAADELLSGQLVGGRGVVELHEVLGERLEVLEEEHTSDLDDGQVLEDGAVVLGEVGVEALAGLVEVAPVHVRGDVVGHVAVLAEVVVVAADHVGVVDTLDGLVVLVLDERVEGDVHEAEEEGHADEGLEVHVEDEGPGAGEEEENTRIEDVVLEQALGEDVRLLVMATHAEHDPGRDTGAVHADAVEKDHEVREGSAIDIVLVERVSCGKGNKRMGIK